MMSERGWGRGRGPRRWTILAGALVAVLLVVGGGLAIYSARALARFERVEARRSTTLYASPLVLRPGVHVGALDLAGVLSRLGYREARTPAGPGQFSRSDGAWDIHVGGAGAGRLALTVSDDRITSLRQGGAGVGGVDVGGVEVQTVALPPELLAAPPSSPPRTSASTSTGAWIRVACSARSGPTRERAGWSREAAPSPSSS